MRGWHGVQPPPEDWWQHGGWHYKTVTKTTTTTDTPASTQPVDEEQVRRIVRKEIADIMPVDVPDAPPEDL